MASKQTKYFWHIGTTDAPVTRWPPKAVLREEMLKKKTALLFRMACGISMTVFLAGVVVPGLIRVDSPAQESLQTLGLGGVSFTYKLENVCSAILGGSFGALVVLLLYSLPKPPMRERTAPSV